VDDPDIQRYLGLVREFQEAGYRGLVGRIHDIGHRWVAKRTLKGMVLEIGFGSGRHRLFFSGLKQNYYVSEYSCEHFHAEAWKEFQGHAVRCDARILPFRSNVFQTVISIYNLEHISDLDLVQREVHRVLKTGGRFLVVLPCEGGLFWNLGRELTTRPQIQKKYGINYDKVIAFEHVWDYPGVVGQLKESHLFRLDLIQMFPFRIPTHNLNLIACLQCSVRT